MNANDKRNEYAKVILPSFTLFSFATNVLTQSTNTFNRSAQVSLFSVYHFSSFLFLPFVSIFRIVFDLFISFMSKTTTRDTRLKFDFERNLFSIEIITNYELRIMMMMLKLILIQLQIVFFLFFCFLLWFTGIH